MSKGFIIDDEASLVERMKDYLDTCDADEIARLAGDFFGGTCYEKGGIYEFEPSETYNGNLDDIKKPISIIEILEESKYQLKYVESGKDIFIHDLDDNLIWEGEKEEFIKSVLNSFNVNQQGAS